MFLYISLLQIKIEDAMICLVLSHPYENSGGPRIRVSEETIHSPRIQESQSQPACGIVGLPVRQNSCLVQDFPPG